MTTASVVLSRVNTRGVFVVLTSSASRSRSGWLLISNGKRCLLILQGLYHITACLQLALFLEKTAIDFLTSYLFGLLHPASCGNSTLLSSSLVCRAQEAGGRFEQIVQVKGFGQPKKATLFEITLRQ